MTKYKHNALTGKPDMVGGNKIPPITGTGHVIANNDTLELEAPESFIKYFANEWGNPQQKWLDANTQSGLTLNGYAYGTQTPYRRLTVGDNWFAVGGYDNTGANANSPKEYSIFNTVAGYFNFGYVYPGALNYGYSFFTGTNDYGIELNKVSANGAPNYFHVEPGRFWFKAIRDTYGYDLLGVERDCFFVRGLTDRDGGVPRMSLCGSGLTVYGNEYGNANFYERLQLFDNFIASKLFHESYGAYENFYMGHNSFVARGYDDSVGAMRDLLNAQFGSFTVGNIVTGNVFSAQNGVMSVGYFDNNTGPNTVFQVHPYSLNLYGTTGDITCAINPGGIDIYDTSARRFFRAGCDTLEHYAYDYTFSESDSRRFYRHFCASSDSSVIRNSRGLILRQSNPGCNHTEALIVATDNPRMEYKFWDEPNARSANVLDVYNGRFAVYYNDSNNGNNDVTFAAHNGSIHGYYRDYATGIYTQYFNAAPNFFVLQDTNGIDRAILENDFISFATAETNEPKMQATTEKIRFSKPLTFPSYELPDDTLDASNTQIFVDGSDVKIKVKIDGVMYGCTLGTLAQLN